jgi:hypothetical protein
MFARSAYTAVAEQQAELIACLIRMTGTEHGTSEPTAAAGEFAARRPVAG